MTCDKNILYVIYLLDDSESDNFIFDIQFPLEVHDFPSDLFSSICDFLPCLLDNWWKDSDILAS